METSDLISLIRLILFTAGIVGVVFVLAVFTEVHWGWMVVVGIVAIGALQNAMMKNLEE